jgi:hypothetical protein
MKTTRILLAFVLLLAAVSCQRGPDRYPPVPEVNATEPKKTSTATTDQGSIKLSIFSLQGTSGERTEERGNQ